MYTSTGRLIYDPRRPGLKEKTKWWCVLLVDREITRWCRWWVKREHWIDLCQPSWDAHVSVIRGEKPNDEQMHLWRNYHGKVFEFKYSNRVVQNGNFWLVKVEAPELKAIREEFGFPSNWSLHLTIGRTWY